MFDVFTEEVEVLVKDGIANLYWYKADLQKAWLRSGVTELVRNQVIARRTDEGTSLSKRQQMDALYEILRTGEYNRRLEVSRNFVRILAEQTIFTAQDGRHRIDIAERCSLKIRDLLRLQEKELQTRDSLRAMNEKSSKETYGNKLHNLRLKFENAITLAPQKKGYALEAIFVELMQISKIQVEEPFRIEGEQLDGAIKFDGHYYLLELKWTADKTEPKEIGHFFYKVEGKLQARGIFLSMNGFTSGTLATLPKGKELKMILLDGVHLANVIYGVYKFQDLLEYAVRQASLKGEIFCAHSLKD